MVYKLFRQHYRRGSYIPDLDGQRAEAKQSANRKDDTNTRGHVTALAEGP